MTDSGPYDIMIMTKNINVDGTIGSVAVDKMVNDIGKDCYAHNAYNIYSFVFRNASVLFNPIDTAIKTLVRERS